MQILENKTVMVDGNAFAAFILTDGLGIVPRLGILTTQSDLEAVAHNTYHLDLDHGYDPLDRGIDPTDLEVLQQWIKGQLS